MILKYRDVYKSYAIQSIYRTSGDFIVFSNVQTSIATKAYLQLTDSHRWLYFALTAVLQYDT